MRGGPFFGIFYDITWDTIGYQGLRVRVSHTKIREINIGVICIKDQQL